ncbi:hypothetical protein CASFOL_039357 [Castilleja foliolosa]|uniref:Senescence regulator n=1 Tax=Castilleja foliolosa TaxID=1961234 RepID=A0ABD3BHR7_9LAMI
MSEEFEESEVIFEDYEVEDEDETNSELNSIESRNKVKTNTTKSMPVSIPENVAWLRDADLDDGGEMVPPHVIVRRRVAGKMMAFSVCTGIGRTLKGRDLSEVRNSVLRMTGFLET